MTSQEKLIIELSEKPLTKSLIEDVLVDVLPDNLKLALVREWNQSVYMEAISLIYSKWKEINSDIDKMSEELKESVINSSEEFELRRESLSIFALNTVESLDKMFKQGLFESSCSNHNKPLYDHLNTEEKRMADDFIDDIENNDDFNPQLN